jgi:hypothetical protein
MFGTRALPITLLPDFMLVLLLAVAVRPSFPEPPPALERLAP